MALLERSDDLGYQLVCHHQLHLPLFHHLDPASLPEKRLAAVQRAKLALAQGLPSAVVIVADAPATSGEHSGLDHVDMAGGDEEGELVHALVHPHPRIAEHAHQRGIFVPLVRAPGVLHRAEHTLRVRHHDGHATVAAGEAGDTAR